MWGTLGKYVGGKVLTAILVVATGCGVIWFWKHPEHLESIWVTLKYVLAWLGFVLVLPWATFFVTSWVVSKDSNGAAALMLVGYAMADIWVAVWLIGGVSGHNALTWAVLLLGVLSAAVYNFKVCELQAERLEGGI